MDTNSNSNSKSSEDMVIDTGFGAGAVSPTEAISVVATKTVSVLSALHTEIGKPETERSDEFKRLEGAIIEEMQRMVTASTAARDRFLSVIETGKNTIRELDGQLKEDYGMSAVSDVK